MLSVKEMKTLDWVRKLLKWWGEWQRAVASSGFRLTYPHTSPCIHIGESRTPPAPLPQPQPIVHRVDAAMTELSTFRADLYMALRYKYEYQYTDPDAAMEMHVSKTVYQTMITSGEHFIAGKIT